MARFGDEQLNRLVEQALGSSPSLKLAQARLNRLVDQQAYMLAANDVFYASALIFLALIPLVFLAKNTKSRAGGVDASAGAH